MNNTYIITRRAAAGASSFFFGRQPQNINDMREYLDRSLTYGEYLGLIDGLLAEDKTTGPNRSEAYVHYARLNRQRMKRVEKTATILEPLRNAAAGIRRPMIWLIITEGWCGDAAQNIPVIEKIAAESENVTTRYILRDENPELIGRFLTNGARAIPKLIALDAESLQVLGSWGARPAAAQRLFLELKEAGDTEKLMEGLQRWYNADKGISIQSEFKELITEWGSPDKAISLQIKLKNISEELELI